MSEGGSQGRSLLEEVTEEYRAAAEAHLGYPLKKSDPEMLLLALVRAEGLHLSARLRSELTAVLAAELESYRRTADTSALRVRGEAEAALQAAEARLRETLGEPLSESAVVNLTAAVERAGAQQVEAVCEEVRQAAAMRWWVAVAVVLLALALAAYGALALHRLDPAAIEDRLQARQDAALAQLQVLRVDTSSAAARGLWGEDGYVDMDVACRRDGAYDPRFERLCAAWDELMEEMRAEGAGGPALQGQ